jgi:hypothetical protein
MAPVQLLLASDQGREALYEVAAFKRPMSKRIQNAARIAIVPFVVAVGTVFIPVLHFVLVPAALLVMSALIIRELTMTVSYSTLNLKCPHCESQYIEREVGRLPKRLFCPSCRITSTLS